jgi:hypothetical protein
MIAAPLFAPPPTLFGAPMGDLDDLAPGMVAAVGAFCDHFGGAPGMRLAARTLRYAFWSGWGEVSPAPDGLRDVGDLMVFPLEPAKHAAALRSQFDRLFATGARVLVVGGDRSVAEALRATAPGPVAVIDLTAPEPVAGASAAQLTGWLPRLGLNGLAEARALAPGAARAAAELAGEP